MKTTKMNHGMTMAEMDRSERKAPTKGLVLRRVEITPSDNGGFSVEVSRKPGREGAKHEPLFIEPKVYTFEGVAGLFKFLADTLGEPKAKKADAA